MGVGRLLALAATVLALVACGTGERTTDDRGPVTSDKNVNTAQKFPDVTGVEVTQSGNTYDFSVTISSPYDTPERYADGWRVRSADGDVYGEHTLAHDHADEQPFTRKQEGVHIPANVRTVIVEGRDSEHGYGGGTEKVTLP